MGPAMIYVPGWMAVDKCDTVPVHWFASLLLLARGKGESPKSELTRLLNIQRYYATNLDEHWKHVFQSRPVETRPHLSLA